MKRIIISLTLAVLAACAAFAQSPSSAPAPSPALSLENVAQPEVYAFLLMRRLAKAEAGTESYDIRQQIEQMRAIIHDRKRKVSGNWMSPDDFVQRRSSYQVQLKEAADLVRKFRPAKKGAKDPLACQKLRSAAASWHDTAIKAFLLGIAEYESDNFTNSVTHFQTARKLCPQIAAIHQGEAMALLEADRALDALSASIELLKLRPDSADALALAVRCQAATPGAEMKSAAYIAAKELISQYEPPKASTPSFGMNWLMPGRMWPGRAQSLPVPPVDRFVHRQAVAVPIAENMLLVDEALVKDAMDIFIRVDSKTVVPAMVKIVTSPRKDPKPPALAILVVKGYSFDPLKLQDLGDIAQPLVATVHSAGVFREMGADIREAAASIAKGTDGKAAVDAELRAGEGAAPIITKDGNLAGFMTGRVDMARDDGGPSAFVPSTDIAVLMKLAAAGSAVITPSRLKRTAATQPAKGTAFMATAISAELFTEK